MGLNSAMTIPSTLRYNSRTFFTDIPSGSDRNFIFEIAMETLNDMCMELSSSGFYARLEGAVSAQISNRYDLDINDFDIVVTSGSFDERCDFVYQYLMDLKDHGNIYT
ncbi:MAG TPA: hypothetical protein PK957_04600 [Candidatus Dojkabacteria bacterium]|nr:hypothetical protein [Candidatus Dojkabacteria bacterium]HQF36659.1 hypothetical protein [Candidatus Dojkabacteria bacterium]